MCNCDYFKPVVQVLQLLSYHMIIWPYGFTSLIKLFCFPETQAELYLIGFN